MSGVRQETVAKDEDGLRLDRWFKRRFPDLPHVRLQKLARSGQVRLDGKRVKPADRIQAGQTVRVPPLGAAPEKQRPRPAPAASPEDAAMIEGAVIFEDDSTLALNKPPGLASQGGTGTARHVDGLLAAIRPNDERPRLVHRLDRDTSGVLLLGKSPEAAAKLSQSFRDRSARKVYWALVNGVPKPERGIVDLPLKKAGGKGSERMVWDAPDGDRAKTAFAVMEKAGRFAALVALAPFTGRTHQLRAHMAAIGCPILGDRKYGGDDAILPGMQLPKAMMLHARSLDVPSPSGGGRLFLEAEPPEAFNAALKHFGFTPELAEDPFAELER